MNNFLNVALLFVMLVAINCQTEKELSHYRVGDKMPDILKKTLMEENETYTKWRVGFRHYVTCKKDTIVAIWRDDR